MNDILGKITVLYGSETGNAQDVAERIWREAKYYHFHASVQPLNDYSIVELIYEQFVVFVCSTTGQGEEPDNMKTFWKFLLRKNLPPDSLSNVQYAIVGLGDSSYAKYNFAAKRLNKRLLQLGARLILPIGLADDQHDLGYDAVVDEWLPALWARLLEIFPMPAEVQIIPTTALKIEPRWKINVVDTKDSVASISNNDNTEKLSIYYSNSFKNPSEAFCATVKTNTRVTTLTHFQDVRLIKFSTNGEHYEPGDVLYVRPHNSKEKIDELYDIFKSNNVNIDPETLIQITEKDEYMPVPNCLQNKITFQKLCEEYFDLNAIPRRNVFTILAQLTSCEIEKEKFIEFTTPEGQEDLYNYCNRPRRNITEVLRDFPHAVENITVDILFEIFSPIRPRAFSIASSCLAHKNEVHILVAVVKYKSKLVKERLGLCSNWLKGLIVGEKVPIWIKKGSFRFPEKKDAPIIMVGPGTGVAPFRNYICEAELLDKIKAERSVLFFGCRNHDHDFLCKDDFNRLEEEQKLAVICAFSRDQDYKIYVQHKIEENGEKVWKLLNNPDCYIFVAGNSKNMPQSVKEAFTNVCTLHGKLKEEDSKIFIDKMEKNERYQTETWS